MSKMSKYRKNPEVNKSRLTLAFYTKGSFRLERSRAVRSKDRNKATTVTTKLQRSNALICFTEHTLKCIENEALLRYATHKCERAFRANAINVSLQMTQ